MDMNDDAFFEAIEQVYIPADECLNYIEVGIDRCMTIHGMSRRLKGLRGDKWRIFGADCHAWDAGFRKQAPTRLGSYLEAIHDHPADIETAHKDASVGKVNIYPVGSCNFLQSVRVKPHFIFIDACHSMKCNTADFLLAELIIQKGGIIAIHDIDPEYQSDGDKSEYHCDVAVEVLESLKFLGIDHQPGEVCDRPGWIVVNRTSSKLEGTHGVLVLKRTIAPHPLISDNQL